MIFQYTAIDTQGARLSDTIEADTLNQAQRELMQRGLMVLNVAKKADRKTARRESKSKTGSSESTNASKRFRSRLSELVVFAKQMSVMMQAGASVVPSLRAIRDQARRPGWKAVLTDLIDNVEGGSALHEAMAKHPNVFTGTTRSIVGAGEETGNIGPAFQHLSRLLESRYRIKTKVVSSLAYPAMLSLLAIGVVITMTLFVLPRFASLFEMLDTDLPALTVFMLKTAETAKSIWHIGLAALVGAIGAAVVVWKTTNVPQQIGRLVLRIPVLGKAFGSVLLTQVLQLWGAALKSHVPLLSAIQHARDVSSNMVIRELVNETAEAVREGRQMSEVLTQYDFVPPPVIAAVATGEQTGKLGDTIEFVGQWLEEESSALLNSLTRMVEPIILVCMGGLVGTVAISLFLPLFELASAA